MKNHRCFLDAIQRKEHRLQAGIRPHGKIPLNISDSQQMVAVTRGANLLTWETHGHEQQKHTLK